MVATPCFRAKRIDRDGYVEGFLFKSYGAYYIANDKASKICDSEGGTVLGYDISEEYSDAFEIDPTTLAIHFESMTDIKGDKIFASLQEDGKGGDILFDMEYEFTLIFNGLKFRLEGLECNTEINEYDKFTNFDSIGIQQ
jgi:hypothetical protein